MQMIIDRMENGVAVCFDRTGKRYSLPLSSLPEGVREGDVIEPVGDTCIVLREDTALRRETATRLLQKIKHKQE